MSPSSLPLLAPCTSLANRLRDAQSFVDVATTSCAAARQLGLHCAVSLYDVSGKPSLTVDNATDSPENIFVLALPVLALTEQIGLVRWSAPSPLSTQLRDELVTMTMHVAVRLAQLGYTTCEDRRTLLTERQADTARLAVRGHTNNEIAELLTMSENTVKKHLKDVFERLQVSSRVELAIRYARLAANDDVPDGVTERAGCTVTKHR